jgi:microsomal dipeptidase-like Zn-dependent dipeptidase
MVQLTDVLISDGFTDAEIGAIMGGNALRLLTATLPRREARAAV